MAEQVLWKRGKTLGKGGFGFVSLASTSNCNAVTLDGVCLPSLIAVKSCIRSRSQSLQQECDFLRMFDSPYIIRCYGNNSTYEDKMVLFNLLVEYASGGSLADRLHNNYLGKGLPELEVKKHTRNVLLGLNQIHGKGIVHCDIKPDNILLVGDDESTAKIADFGLAVTLEQSWTQDQGLRGTKRYMAPESVRKHEYGPEVDVWALGCTVFELITGTPLWVSNEDDLLYRIGSEEPNLENEKLSKDAKDFLKICLAKDPTARWTANMLLNHSFMKLADNVQPTKTRKKQSYLSRLHRPHQKRAFKTQPHIRDLVIGH